MSDSKEVLANRISKWNWKFFFQVAHELGDQFDDHTWRFLKAEVLAIALEMSSDGVAKYVDETGYDLDIGGMKINLEWVSASFLVLELEEVFNEQLINKNIDLK